MILTEIAGHGMCSIYGKRAAVLDSIHTQTVQNDIST